MSIWEWAMRILEMEERIREGIAGRPELSIPLVVTYEKDFPEMTIGEDFTVLEDDGFGELKVFIVKTLTPNYSISIITAGKDVYRRKSFSDFQEVSLGNPDIDATVDPATGEHYLRIGSISFEGSIRIIIHVDEPTPFKRIYYKYVKFEKRKVI